MKVIAIKAAALAAMTCLILALSSPALAMDKMLLDAVRDGTAATVESALKSGADPDARDEDGETALMLAALLGKVDVMQALIAAGADVNALNRSGSSVLYRLRLDSRVVPGRYEAMRLLAVHGAASIPEEAGNKAVKITATDGAILIENTSPAPVYVAALARALLPQIEWAPCETASACREQAVPPGGARLIRPGKAGEYVVLWWRIQGGYRPASLRSKNIIIK